MNERLRRQVTCIGEARQARLANVNIAIIGCGGVGSEVAPQFAKMGANLILVEPKHVSASNAGRQSLYRPGDEGRMKVHVAYERLQRINPDILIQTVPTDLRADNAELILDNAGVVLDCTDSIEARRVIDRTARKLGKPWVYCGVVGWIGQVNVFLPGGTPLERVLPEHRTQGAADPHDVGTMTPAVVMVAAIGVAMALQCLWGEAKERQISFDLSAPGDPLRFMRVGTLPGA